MSSEVIKNTRERFGLSQDQMGRILGTDWREIYGWEEGTYEPDMEKFSSVFVAQDRFMLPQDGDVITVLRKYFKEEPWKIFSLEKEKGGAGFVIVDLLLDTIPSLVDDLVNINKAYYLAENGDDIKLFISFEKKMMTCILLPKGTKHMRFTLDGNRYENYGGVNL